MIRVLLVDDDEAAFTNTRALLGPGLHEHYEIAWTGSYGDAVRILRETPPDVALIDYRLGAWSGLELIEEVLRTTPTPLILITGEGDRDVDEAALAAGAADHIERQQLTGPLLDRAIRYAITRRRALEAARRSEERFRTIIETSSEGLALLDGAGQVIFESPAVTTMLGYSVEEMKGRHFSEFTHPDDLPKSEAAFTRALEQPDEVVDVEVSARHKDGTWRTLEARIVNRLNQPAVGAIVCNFRDVTERRASERQFRAVFENALDAMVITDDDARYLAVNAAAVRLYGLQREELLQRSGAEFAPPDVDHAGLWRKFIEAGHMSGAYRLKHAGGTFRDVEFSAVANFIPGRHLSILRDATDRVKAERERIQSERKFATVFSSSPVAMFIAERGTWRIIDANPSFAELTGYSLDEIRGRTTLELNLYTEPTRREQVVRQVAAGETIRNREGQIRRRTGEVRDILASLEHIVLEGTERPLFVAIVTDVTEQRLLEQQFRQAQKMEAVGRLAGGIAHDFNNLLTAIIGYAELIASRDDVPDDVIGDVNEIMKAGRSAAALTGQLLAFSRRSMLEPRAIDVNAVVRNMESLLQRLLGEDIALESKLAESAGIVRADLGQIEQVIVNLAVNARDAMPSGGRLTIETGRATLDELYVEEHRGASVGPHVMIAVSDTGVGMDETVKARLFEPFFTTKERGKGTGLGLATVYGAVKQSGGSIWVYSEPGAGSTFKIYLPVVEGQTPSEQPAVESGTLEGTETILLVEDQESVRNLTREVLTRHGYSVVEAASPSEALDLLAGAGERIQLLLTDVVMPGMSGRQLARLCHERHPHIRVLYMSGYAPDAIVSHGILDADLAFIQKPFAARPLLEKVRSVLSAEKSPAV